MALYLCDLIVFLFADVLTAGNIGAELSYNNVGMFISSDAGNSWRQVSFSPTLTSRSSQLIGLLALFTVYWDADIE